MNKRHTKKRNTKDDAIAKLLHRAFSIPVFPVPLLTNEDPIFNDDVVIDWKSLPDGLDPCFGNLETERVVRKRQQVASILSHVRPLLFPGDCVVDFGSGSG